MHSFINQPSLLFLKISNPIHPPFSWYNVLLLYCKLSHCFYFISSLEPTSMSCRVVLYLNDGLPASLLLYFCCCTFSHPSIIFHNKLKDLFWSLNPPLCFPFFINNYHQLEVHLNNPSYPTHFIKLLTCRVMLSTQIISSQLQTLWKKKIYKLVLFLLSPNVLLYIMIINSPIMNNGIKFIFFPTFDFSLIFIIWSEFNLTYILTIS